MYKFIEIECPKFKHHFIWFEHTYKGLVHKLYRRIGTNELLESTACPKCNIEMAIVKDSHIGIDITDELIEVAEILHGI